MFLHKKSHCDIHATLKQRLKAVELLSSEHKITTLCRVLNVNRSTYYKYINHKESKREQENKYIRSCILELYAKSNKRLGISHKKYITKIKISTALNLLTDSDLPLAEISSIVGFEDYNYFCRIIKKETGLSPSCFRK